MWNVLHGKKNDSHGLSSFDVLLEEITSYCNTHNTLIPDVDFVLQVKMCILNFDTLLEGVKRGKLKKKSRVLT